MRIESVEVENLRCMKDCKADLANYTCFVGANGAGKSTLFCALNLFFRNVESAPTDMNNLVKEDFHLLDTSKPIKVRITFRDLSTEAKKVLQDYVRQEKLVVTAIATFNSQTGKAEVKQYGERLGMIEFAPFFEAYADDKAVAFLKERYEDIRKSVPEIDTFVTKATKDGMRDGLRAFENMHASRCVLIPSEDQFYGVSQGKDRLAKFVQWIYVPAVKDVSDEQMHPKRLQSGDC